MLPRSVKYTSTRRLGKRKGNWSGPSVDCAASAPRGTEQASQQVRWHIVRVMPHHRRHLCRCYHCHEQIWGRNNAKSGSGGGSSARDGWCCRALHTETYVNNIKDKRSNVLFLWCDIVMLALSVMLLRLLGNNTLAARHKHILCFFSSFRFVFLTFAVCLPLCHAMLSL